MTHDDGKRVEVGVAIVLRFRPMPSQMGLDDRVKGRRTQRANNIGNFVAMGGDRKSSQNRQYKTGHV